jgi:putative spermidine/putrescine transport system substrate-binding protein
MLHPKSTTMLAGLLAAAATLPAGAQDMDALVAAAKAEGTLTTIALPHDWCNYGGVIEGFKAKFGLEVNELDPDAGSADELEAIRANKGNTGPQAPDVVDIGYSYGPAAQKEGLLQPYKVSTWDTIPDDVKDPDGNWYADYYGVMSFMVNKDLVPEAPADWADLMKPEYAGIVALSGDPKASNQATSAVHAAGLSTGAEPGKAAAEAGLKFFAALNDAGNFVPVTGKAGTLAQGATPIVIYWDYNSLTARDTLQGNPPVEVVVPKTGAVAGIYVQGISAFAPHPNAAKLWMEYLYSDEGQLKWLEGSCPPIRFNDLAARGVIPQELPDKLPPPAAYESAIFPTLEQQDAAGAEIKGNWDNVVGVTVPN